MPIQAQPRGCMYEQGFQTMIFSRTLAKRGPLRKRILKYVRKFLSHYKTRSYRTRKILQNLSEISQSTIFTNYICPNKIADEPIGLVYDLFRILSLPLL